MAAYRRVCDSRHLQADCQEPGSAPEPYTIDNRVRATFTFTSLSQLVVAAAPVCVLVVLKMLMAAVQSIWL